MADTPEIVQQQPHRPPLSSSPPPMTAYQIPIHPSVSLPIDSPKPERQSSQDDPLPPVRHRGHRSSPSRWITWSYHTVGALGLAWSTLCIVRYSLAVSTFRDDIHRKNYAVAFAVLSLLGWIAIALVQSVPLLAPSIRRRTLVEQLTLLFASLSLLTPALFNLAFVALWRRSPTPLSLFGRCHWDLDVVWSGQPGQCEHGVPWGAWLAGSILRVCFTLVGLCAMHSLAWMISNGAPSRHSSPRSRPRSHSTQSLVGSRGNKLRRGGGPRIPPFAAGSTPPDSSSSTHEQDHRRTFSSSTNTHYTPNHFLRSPRSASPPNIPPRSPSRLGQHPAIPSSTSPRSSGEDRPVSPRSSDEHDDGGDLNAFAANFRTMVERVTRETEDGSRLPSSPSSGSSQFPPTSRLVRSETPPSAFPHRHSPDQMQRDLLQAHRLMLIEQAMRAESYEHVVVLGNAVRRMSTIPSIADNTSEPPWTPTSTNASVAAPRELTRSPTNSTARSGRKAVPRRGDNGHTPTPPSTGGSGDSPEEDV